MPINHLGSLYFLTDIRDNLNLIYTSSIIKCKLLTCYKYPVFSFLCFTSMVYTTRRKYLRGNTVHSLCKFACFVHIVVSVCFFQKIEILQNNILRLLLQVIEASKKNKDRGVNGGGNGDIKKKRPKNSCCVYIKIVKCFHTVRI